MLKSENYDIFDLVKLILSIMIVAIHTSLFPTILYPWLRLAVPLFFVISSFLLFSKLNNSAPSESTTIIKKFVSRQLNLYLFWFVVLFPITISVRIYWFDSGILKGIYTTIKNTLFSSTFIASWFITSTITATFIVYKISKKLNYKILFIIFLIIYSICCVISSYSNLFTNIYFINKLYNIYLIIFPSPVFSFPVALLWIFIGKLFADGIIKKNIKNKKIHLLLIILFCTLLFLEWKFVIWLNGTYNNDCYFFLVPIVLLVFQLLLNLNINLKYSKLFRKVSTITYPLHASYAHIFSQIAKKWLFINNDTVVGIFSFITTLLFCYITCYTIFKLEDNKYLKILKYSH